MSDIEQARQALLKRTLEGAGQASVFDRRAAFNNGDLGEPLDALVCKVATYAYSVTDEDINSAKGAGLSEDEIFEIVVCAAIGEASRQLDAALAALETAYRKD